MKGADLAARLLDLVRQQKFGGLVDYLHGGQPISHFPSIDLALVAFPQAGAPVYANVLFSRQHPQGFVADIAPAAGPVTNVAYLRDFTDKDFASPAWFRDADWARMDFAPLAGQGTPFLEPYPASLIKTMVAVGIARLNDEGRVQWEELVDHAGRLRSVTEWCEAMITESCNIATEALVKVLHRAGAIVRSGDRETRNEVEARLHAFGLTTLTLTDTKPDGGWRIPDGAGVGHLNMTAWDSARLFWLLDEAAPRAPWLASDEPLLSPANTRRVMGMMARQGLHIMLSSASLAGVPLQAPGIPAQLPLHWIMKDGSCHVTDGYTYPPDVRPARARAQVLFANKTGGTDNYGSNAGVVTGLGGRRRHYIVAILTNIGKRYAERPQGVVSGRLPALGRAIDDLMTEWLE